MGISAHKGKKTKKTKETKKTVHESLMVPFTERLEKKLSNDYLIKKLKEELKAKETKFFQHEGKVIESRDIIAWNIRQKARMDAHRLLGHYPAEKKQLTGPNGGPVEFIINISGEEDEPDSV